MCRLIFEWLLPAGNSRRWRLVGRSESLRLEIRSSLLPLVAFSLPPCSFPLLRLLWCKESHFSGKISCSHNILPHYAPKAMEPWDHWLKHLKSWTQIIFLSFEIICLWYFVSTVEKTTLPPFILQSALSCPLFSPLPKNDGARNLWLDYRPISETSHTPELRR